MPRVTKEKKLPNGKGTSMVGVRKMSVTHDPEEKSRGGRKEARSLSEHRPAEDHSRGNVILSVRKRESSIREERNEGG